MLTLHNGCYQHPDKDVLFSNISLTINKYDKIALTGNNGAGKSTLLRILAGQLPLSAGKLSADARPYYVPQLVGQYNELSIAAALGVGHKLAALKNILAGNVTEENMTLLDDDWTIEERCNEALSHWQLQGHRPDEKIGKLSGGQKTRVLLAGLRIHQPQLVLLDEPSNHLDTESRAILYDYISTTTSTLMVVSHDRTLLRLLPAVYELDKRGITVYGGNYDFYMACKQAETDALQDNMQDKSKALRKARDTERAAIERDQKLDARGKKKQEKAGLPTIAMNTLRNNAEKSTARMKEVHAGKTEGISRELNELRQELPDADKMKMIFESSPLHKGKILVDTQQLQASYDSIPLWRRPLRFSVLSGMRVAVKGGNGSGKTTLIKLLLGRLRLHSGSLHLAYNNALYVDQDYSLINNQQSVYEQAQEYNSGALQEHEIKIRLSRFLFDRDSWDKKCAALSGGERMRLMLCCLTIATKVPDIIILDEPTNNLDLQNVAILTAAINEYKGTLIVVSHDSAFMEEINMTDSICLE